jgi:hypothetical protein
MARAKGNRTMKTTRIDIEGPVGTATIRRDGRQIIISGTRVTKVIERRDGKGVPISEAFQLEADARETALNGQVARTLQVYLDGCQGTAGDIAAYRQIIATFED